MSSTKCEECYVGRYQPVTITYMRRLGSKMLVLPNAPANRCDMCGHVDFDPGFLQTMQAMMANYARNPQMSGRKKTPVAELPREWPSVRGSSK